MAGAGYGDPHSYLRSDYINGWRSSCVGKMYGSRASGGKSAGQRRCRQPQRERSCEALACGMPVAAAHALCA